MAPLRSMFKTNFAEFCAFVAPIGCPVLSKVFRSETLWWQKKTRARCRCAGLCCLGWQLNLSGFFQKRFRKQIRLRAVRRLRDRIGFARRRNWVPAILVRLSLRLETQRFLEWNLIDSFHHRVERRAYGLIPFD